MVARPSAPSQLLTLPLSPLSLRATRRQGSLYNRHHRGQGDGGGGCRGAQGSCTCGQVGPEAGDEAGGERCQQRAGKRCQQRQEGRRRRQEEIRQAARNCASLLCRTCTHLIVGRADPTLFLLCSRPRRHFIASSCCHPSPTFIYTAQSSASRVSSMAQHIHTQINT